MAGPVVGVVFTPFPVGEMPTGVEAYESGPPHGRVRLVPVEVGEGWLRDEATGKKFAWRPAD